MERAALSASAPQPSAAFLDGLGERRHIVDPSGSEKWELLCLRGELAEVPSFEFALRERVSRLSVFRHAYYGRVRAIERLTDRDKTLAVVSELTPGVRLSDLLARTDEHKLGLDINTALCLIRQLVPAIAILHETARDVAHGALGPERLVVTPNARLVVVEYVLGAALEQLRFSQERYWHELRIALPRTVGLPRFDQRADVTQIGIVALSLILGRPLKDDEYPARIGDVVASTWALSSRGGYEPLPSGLRGWLGRALQLDARNAFASALEARVELDKVLGDTDYIASPGSLEAFLSRYHLASGAPAPDVRPTENRSASEEAHPHGSEPDSFDLEPPAPAVPPRSQPDAHVATSSPTSSSQPTPSSPASAHTPLGQRSPFASPASAQTPLAQPSPNSMQSAFTPGPEPSPFAPPPPSSPFASPSASATPNRQRSPFAPPDRELTPRSQPSPFAAPERDVTPRSQPSPFAAGSGPTPHRQPSPFSSEHEPVSRPQPSLYSVSAQSSAPRQVPPEVQSFAESVTPKRSPAPVATASTTAPASSSIPVPSFSPSWATPADPAPSLPPAFQPPTPIWRQPKAIAAAVALLVIAAAGIFFARGAFDSPPPVVTGTLVITTNPSGARAIVDGEARGTTPLTLTLSAGQHTVELMGGGEPRTIPVTITAGAETAQYIELPAAPEVPTALGELRVRTDPPGARVTIDGVARGTSPTLVTDLTSGEHSVLLESDLGSVRQVVTIEAGTTASLVVPLTAAEGAPVSGWVSVSSPVEMQLFEGDRLIGTTLSDRIMMSAGRHDLTFVNEELGYRSARTVQVAPGRVATVALEVPQGTIALNAQPWAEIWIDGERVGETPIGNLPIKIGRHSVLFRHPELGEQQHSATVRAGTVTRLSVDMRKR